MLILCVSLSSGRFGVPGKPCRVTSSPQDHTQERFDLHIAVGPVSSSCGYLIRYLGAARI